MKKLSVFILIISILLFSGCAQTMEKCDIVATTLPVYDFTSILCEGTDLTVGRLVTESVSCLHDYTLKVDQMRMIEGSDIIVISGAGLEDFLDDALNDSGHIIDASIGAHLHSGGHDHEGHDDHSHSHEKDPHIWLSTQNAKIMAENICSGLSQTYPEHQEVFLHNL